MCNLTLRREYFTYLLVLLHKSVTLGSLKKYSIPSTESNLPSIIKLKNGQQDESVGPAPDG